MDIYILIGVDTGYIRLMNNKGVIDLTYLCYYSVKRLDKTSVW